MKKMTYKFNLNYLKSIIPNIDLVKTTKKYKELMLPFLKVRFKYHTVKVQAVKQQHDGELHDVSFDCDSRQEEIQTTSIVRSHITTMFQQAKDWVVYIGDKENTSEVSEVEENIEEEPLAEEIVEEKPVKKTTRAKKIKNEG